MKKTIFLVLLIILVLILLFIVFSVTGGFFDKLRASLSVPEQRPVSNKLIDLNNPPIIDDCMNDERASFKNETPPTDDRVNITMKHANILLDFSSRLKSGYSVGRIRAESFGLPGGGFCLSWFDVGIREDETGRIDGKFGHFDHSFLSYAFAFTNHDLANIGRLLFGDTVFSYESIKKHYEEVRKMPYCSENKPYNCLQTLKRLPRFEDGSMVLRFKLGSIRPVLRRYIISRYGDASQYAEIYLRDNGSIDLVKTTLYAINTGIMF